MDIYQKQMADPEFEKNITRFCRLWNLCFYIFAFSVISFIVYIIFKVLDKNGVFFFGLSVALILYAIFLLLYTISNMIQDSYEKLWEINKNLQGQ